MMIIADSGSTKCSWTRYEAGRVERRLTRGINAVQHSREEIEQVLRELHDWGSADEVWFYGAGCSEKFPEAQKRLRNALSAHFRARMIATESDLKGAARALFGRGEGIACILGTGSNSCWCRGGEIVENVPPLGYILGDEGSGAVLGRNLVNGILKGHIPLKDEFYSETRLTYEELIARVYREPSANRFLASLAPFVRRHTDCAEVREMAKECFRQFARRNLTRYPRLRVGCVGSIAHHFEDLVREALLEEGFTIDHTVASPDEGLLNYHTQNG